MDEDKINWLKVIVGGIWFVLLSSPLFVVLWFLMLQRWRKLKFWDPDWKFNFSITDIFIATLTLSPALCFFAWAVTMNAQTLMAACLPIVLVQIVGMAFGKLLSDDPFRGPPSPVISGSAILGGGFFGAVFLYAYSLVAASGVDFWR